MPKLRSRVLQTIVAVDRMAPPPHSVTNSPVANLHRLTRVSEACMDFAAQKPSGTGPVLSGAVPLRCLGGPKYSLHAQTPSSPPSQGPCPWAVCGGWKTIFADPWEPCFSAKGLLVSCLYLKTSSTSRLCLQSTLAYLQSLSPSVFLPEPSMEITL